MKRTEKKKLTLTRHDLRTLALTPLQLQHVVGASANQPGCGPRTGSCTHQK